MTMSDNRWDEGQDDFFQPMPTGNTDLLEGLNPSQQEAVQTIAGPLMIIAGPGSGKTRVVTHRIANMIRSGIPSDQIVALTFTNKAAEEMKNRLSKLIPGHFVWAGTFHRFCAQLLRQYAPLVGLGENFSILDVADAKKVMEMAWAEADIRDDFVRLATVQNEISKIKNAMILPEELAGRSLNAVGTVAEKVYPVYQKLLLQQNAVDFDDLLLKVAVMLKENEDLRSMLDQRFHYMLVDEYQDTNLAQYAIVRALSRDCQNLSVTGDPDQSIYGWRGANSKNILNFESDFPNTKVVKLEHNYRSKNNILHAADRLISNNSRRKAKRLIGVSGPGDPVRLISFPNPKDEADFIAADAAHKIENGVWEPSDIAVFYRANWLSRNLEHAFGAEKVPYQLVNGYEFYQRKEVKDLIAYLRLLDNPKNDVALQRVINTPSRKIGKVTVGKILDAASAKGVSMLQQCELCVHDGTLAKRSATAVAKFVTVMNRLQEFAASSSVELILKKVLEFTGYRELLVGEESEAAAEQVANIDELLTAAAEFDSQHPEDGGLEAYLETAALASDTDKFQSDQSTVKLMTMHASKGLEFPCVYIVGLEEGIVPHERSREDSRELEEERRLLFVGVTRAEEELTMTRSENRVRRGVSCMAPASSFLREFPIEEFNVIQPGRRNVRVSEFDDFDFPSDDFDLQQTGDDQDWVDQQCGGQSIEMEGEVDAHQGTSTNQSGGGQFFPGEGPSTSGQTQSEIDPDEAGGDLPEPSDPSAGEEPPENEDAKAKLGQKLMTAADMLGEVPKEKIDPSKFKKGMRVHHPKYGPGEILQLAGTSSKPSVRVKFFSVGEKTFRLLQSQLRLL